MFQRTRIPACTDDDPRIVVALREASEPKGLPWNSFITGCAMELLMLSLVILSEGGVATTSSEPKRTRTTVSVPLYIPPVRRSPVQKPPPVSALTKKHLTKVLEDPAPVMAKVKIDMSSIEISVADDVANEIPAVVRQQNGQLALLEADDPSFARYTFAPPDWHMQKGIVDVSRRVRFVMMPPSRWPLLQTLAANNGIQMERYQVNALFDGKFYACLEQEIRNHADESSATGKVRAVMLAFNSSRSCGIDVLKVEYAPVQ